MKRTAKNVFIDGFRQPSPIDPIPDVLLSDLQGDGQNKLIMFDRSLNSLMVYKGINRQFQKQLQMKNISGMLIFYEQNTRMPVSAENALYIYRGLKESFRLRVPNLVPQPEQQILWTQFQNSPDKLTEALTELSKTKRLTESGKYFIGAVSLQRKQELIKKAFTEGLIEKDSVCAMTVIKAEENAVGNMVLFTELKVMHTLDIYGHSIIKTNNIDIVVHQAFVGPRQMLVCVGRGNSVLIMEKNKSRKFSFQKKVINAALQWPRLYLLTNNNCVSCYNIQTEQVKEYSIKLPSQTVQIQLMKSRTFNCLLVGMKDEVRIYYQRNLVYQLPLTNTLKFMRFGTYGRQEGCLVLIYEQRGFQVKILHRLFNPTKKIEKDPVESQIMDNKIPVPKKSTLFLAQSQAQEEQCVAMHRVFVKDMRMLKWRVLKEQANQKSAKKVKVTSSVMGLGPNFILRIELENITQQVIYDVSLGLSYNSQMLQAGSYRTKLGMMVPNVSYPIEIDILNRSQPSQECPLKLIVSSDPSQTSVVSITMPACDSLA